MRPQPNSTWIAGMKTQPRPCWQKLIPTWSDQMRTEFMPTQLSLTLQCATPPTQPRDTVWTNSHLLWGIRKRMDPCTDGPTRKWTYMHNLYLFSSDWVVEQAQSIFYILQHSTLILPVSREGEVLLRLLLGADCCGREQEVLYYYSEIQVVYIVII